LFSSKTIFFFTPFLKFIQFKNSLAFCKFEEIKIYATFVAKQNILFQKQKNKNSLNKKNKKGRGQANRPRPES
jgi:hypothetical protein